MFVFGKTSDEAREGGGGDREGTSHKPEDFERDYTYFSKCSLLSTPC